MSQFQVSRRPGITFTEMNVSLKRKGVRGIRNFEAENGDNLDVNNYRGITLLPVIAKLLFATLSKRLYAWGELHNIIPVEQFGFRSNHSTTDAILF